LPFFSVAFSVAVLPFFSITVFLPAILKSWLSAPLFVTLNVVAPFAIVFFEIVIFNSPGLPSVTVNVVASVELDPPNADIAATSDTIAIRTTSADPFRNVLKKPLLMCGTPGEPYLPVSLDEAPASWTISVASDQESEYRAPIEPAQLHREIGAPTRDEGSLGTTLRTIRNSRGLSLAQVAKATGISRSLLSLIETGQSDITVGRLTRLALLYEIRVAELVPEPHHPDPIIVRADDRQVLRYSAEEIDVEVLVPDGPHTMQALLATFAPLARMLDYVPQPNEQFTHVIEGRVRTEFADGRVIELAAGDSATYISGDGGHRHTNLVDGVTRMLIVVRRPRFAG